MVFKYTLFILSMICMQIPSMGYTQDSLQTSNIKASPQKFYIPQESLVLHKGRVYIKDNDNLLLVETLHQDDNGVYFVWSWYGSCPNEHPYPPEGGCLGPDECPCSGG